MRIHLHASRDVTSYTLFFPPVPQFACMHVWHRPLPGTVRLHHVLTAERRARCEPAEALQVASRLCQASLSSVPCQSIMTEAVTPRGTHLGHCSKAGPWLLLKQPLSFPFLGFF